MSENPLDPAPGTDEDYILRKGLEAAAELLSLREENRPRLYESVFKKKYLGFLAFDGGMELDMSYWIQGAAGGKPQNSVDVYEDGTDNILFTVPPMLATGVSYDSEKAGYSLRAIGAVAMSQANNNPLAGDEYLRNNVARGGVYDFSVDEHRQQWHAILERYGIPIPGAAKSEVLAESTEESQVAEIFSDEMEDEQGWD